MRVLGRIRLEGPNVTLLNRTALNPCWLIVILLSLSVGPLLATETVVLNRCP